MRCTWGSHAPASTPSPSRDRVSRVHPMAERGGRPHQDEEDTPRHKPPAKWCQRVPPAALCRAGSRSHEVAEVSVFGPAKVAAPSRAGRLQPGRAVDLHHQLPLWLPYAGRCRVEQQADAASSKARTTPGSCRFREGPRMYPTSPAPRGGRPGTGPGPRYAVSYRYRPAAA